MQRILQSVFLALFITVWTGCSSEQAANSPSDDELRAKAARLAQELLIADTHVDIPYRLQEKMEDISQRTEAGDFDYPRAVEGGLNAPFMSIYVPAELEENGGAKALADQLIDMVEKFQQDWPDKFALTRSVEEVRAAFAAGRIALPMGMENGAPIEGLLENLIHFYDRGVRYITLTHSKNNHICDSSYDTTKKWNGLSPFGREVVAEMNRLGIMIDISHVSDDAFYQVLELSNAPVIASHSSCRHFTPGWQRNMDDEMIRKLAEKGGVIQINFGSAFISGEYLEASQKRRAAIQDYLVQNKLTEESEDARSWIRNYDARNPIHFADVSQVADHIDHVRKLVGIDHVGFGSDFDGVGDSLPTGLKDVSQFPNLIFELLKRGYTDGDIEKIASGNTFRVWSAVEALAAK